MRAARPDDHRLVVGDANVKIMQGKLEQMLEGKAASSGAVADEGALVECEVEGDKLERKLKRLLAGVEDTVAAMKRSRAHTSAVAYACADRACASGAPAAPR